jgi:hypothetical protein
MLHVDATPHVFQPIPDVIFYCIDFRALLNMRQADKRRLRLRWLLL